MDAAASLLVLNTAQRLLDTGRHAAVVDYLGVIPPEELRGSPTLALMYGIGQARLGRLEEGAQWVEVALERSRARGDVAVEARALNVLGVIAFERGQVDEAAEHLTRALAEAERAGNHATVGRCSNNLGAIANLRGWYGRAVGYYTMALAAFQQASLMSGTAETLHNLAITYRDQGDLTSALETADRAVLEADGAGDVQLGAQTRVGRSEIRVTAGEPEMAQREVELAVTTHRRLGNEVAEAEDLRVLGVATAAMGQDADAERLFKDVIGRAETHGRPLLAGQAERDLARLFEGQRRYDEALEVARMARVRFMQMGAEVEVKRLDELIGGLSVNLENGAAAARR